MGTVKQFFHKYLRSSLLILFAFLFINAGLLITVLLAAWNNSTDPDIPVSEIADGIHTDGQGGIYADANVSDLLHEKSSWAMVLDEDGVVIWEDTLPDHLPRQYTASQIAKFSRWYLDEYPVLVQELSVGLLVIGCPPDSIVKYNFVTDFEYVRTAAFGTLIVIILNITLLLLLFLHNTRKVEKAVTPILNGIETISQGKAVTLTEKGELAEINAEVNRASKHIQKKDQARAEWISGISHDIRTPLSIMLGYAGEMEDDCSLPSGARAQAGLIRQKGEKLRHLITDLNLTSKLEYSMQPLHMESIDPVELARQTIADFINNGLEEKYVLNVEVFESQNSFFLQGDKSLLERMLDNLILNCISHNENGCNINLTVCQQGAHCEYTISDDGTGISDLQLSQFNEGIFTERDSSDGIKHGWGLRLVYQIAAAHQGKVSFSKNTPNGLKVSILI